MITMSHGSGGRTTHNLLQDIFYKYFHNDILLQQGDASILTQLPGRIAVTTDSYVIKPLFFSGGDIGKLSICGTVNDLAVSGAQPMYITAGFILEEGISLNVLERIVKSMAQTADKAQVKIIAGDTKVVEKGKGDSIYINTTGIGVILEGQECMCAERIEEGDKVIISGTLADHGMCIMKEREGLELDAVIESDCSLLHTLVQDILQVSPKIKMMRDLTRGGLASALNEIAEQSKKGIVINEKHIPVRDDVMGMCELLGIDPLTAANEGKIVVITAEEDAQLVYEAMKKNPLGKNSAIIGRVTGDKESRVYLQTLLGGTRMINMPVAELLPRIC